MAEEKKEHDNKMKKMEAEMEQVFEMKVQEKQAKLKESEADVRLPVDILQGIGGQRLSVDILQEIGGQANSFRLCVIYGGYLAKFYLSLKNENLKYFHFVNASNIDLKYLFVLGVMLHLQCTFNVVNLSQMVFVIKKCYFLIELMYFLE